MSFFHRGLRPVAAARHRRAGVRRLRRPGGLAARRTVTAGGWAAACSLAARDLPMDLNREEERRLLIADVLDRRREEVERRWLSAVSGTLPVGRIIPTELRA